MGGVGFFPHFYGLSDFACFSFEEVKVSVISLLLLWRIPTYEILRWYVILWNVRMFMAEHISRAMFGTVLMTDDLLLF